MLERVREIIQEQLNLDGVEIPSEDLEQITTVGAVIEYMKSKGVEA